MKRRLLTILLPVVAASLGAGCATLTDDNVAVRVNDISYSHDDLDDLVVAVGLPENELQGIRLFATDLVLVGTISTYLDDAGLDPTDADLDAGRAQAQQQASGFAGLSDRLQEDIAEFFAVIAVANTLPDLETSLTEAVADAEIYVDPRIGTFDRSAGAIIPLG